MPYHSWKDAQPKMKPASLSKEEILSLQKDKRVTLVRPVDPQPDGEPDSPITAGGTPIFYDVLRDIIVPPFGSPGEEFWVREEWRVFGWMSDPIEIAGTRPEGLRLTVEYQPDSEDSDTGPSYYPDDKNYKRIRDLVKCYDDECRAREADTMPQWASRYTIIHKGTKVKRVQDVTDEECRIQLADDFDIESDYIPNPNDESVEGLCIYHWEFKKLWQSRYGDKFPWSDNPWVWMVNVEVKGD